jgi:tripartite-type tricarboxylate transporter receptor subunit TctC
MEARRKPAVKRLIVGILLLFGATAYCPLVSAAYPDKPVRIVVPYPPGGSTDVLARIVGQKLSENWGVPVLIDNKPGADTQIGNSFVAAAAPDGYTLLMITTVFAISKGLYPSLPYDPARDFTPISPIASSPFYIVVGSTVPAADLRELVALAKQKPGSLNYSSSSSANYLAGELMKKAAGIDVLNVRYKGSGPGVTAVASGEVTYTLDTLLTAKPLMDAGKVRALAVTGDKRAPQMPNLPTFAEAGVPGFDMVAWFGLGGPKGMSPDVVATINTAVQNALKSPEVRQTIENNAATPMMQTADQFSSFIRSEFSTFEAVVKSNNLKPGS